MNNNDNVTRWRSPAFATVAGALGVLAFSFTMPVTRVAAPLLGGLLVGTGRAAGAGLLAALVLGVTRAAPPPRALVPGLLRVAAGVAVGFPVCASVAMRFVPASHGVVVVGIVPVLTAAVAALRSGERQPLAFWSVSAVGGGIVVAYALRDGGGSLQVADALLGAAALAAALGYAEGAVLARSIGGAAVIAWAMAFAVPVTVPAALLCAWLWPPAWSTESVSALAWLAFVSNYLGFVAWYHGLAHGGVARVGALQLAQPVLGVAWCALLLGEPVSRIDVAAALAVVPCIVAVRAWGR